MRRKWLDNLSLLFNALLKHSFVPDDFCIGIIKPLAKVKHGCCPVSERLAINKLSD